MTNVNLAPLAEAAGLGAAADLDTVGFEGLRFIADGLTGADEGLAAEPTTWSQLNVFEAAFRDPQHPGHAEAVSQWRGLLTTFALSAVFQHRYALDVMNVDLVHAALAPEISEALLRPQGLALAAGLTDDTAVSLITIQGQSFDGLEGATHPVGFVSPLTLLAPADGARSAPVDAMPMLVPEVGFADPLMKDTPNPLRASHIAVLAAFLRGLKAELSFLKDVEGRSPAWRAAADALATQLSAFAEACEARAPGDAPLQTAAMGPRRWPDQPILRALDNTFALVGAGDDLPAKVVRAVSAEDGVSAVVLADPAIAAALDVSAAELSLWGRWTLQDVQNPDAYTQACEDALSAGTLLLRPVDLFTDEAVRMEAAKASAHGADLASWVLPLTPTALFLLAPNVIEERVSVEEGHSAELGKFARFTLHIPIAAGIDHVIERLYAERPDAASGDAGALLKFDGEDEYNPPDLFAVWPNFETPAWRHNFLYFQGNPQIDLLPLIGVSEPLVAREVLKEDDPTRRLMALRGWSDAAGQVLIAEHAADVRSQIPNAAHPHAPWLDRLQFEDAPASVAEIQRLRSLTAVVMTRPGEEQGRRMAGLVIVNRPPAPDPVEHDVVAAIDFGTTGTVAHMAVDGAYRDVVFQGRLHFPTKRAQSGGFAPMAKTALEGFFPSDPVTTPLATAAMRRMMTGRAGEVFGSSFGLDEMGLSDTAYFETSLEQTLQAAERSQLIYGLKWGPSKRIIAKRFLRQIIAMIAAETVAMGVDPASIRWCFSFPEAFSSLERSSFRKVAVLASLEEVFGPDHARPLMYPEATAVVNHLTDPEFYGEGAQTTPFITLDIGGGSTDVVLWDADGVVWRSSFPLGGQMFLTEIIRRNTAFIREIMPGQAGIAELAALLDASAGADQETQDRTLGVIETLLASDQFRDKFEHHYPLMWDDGPAMLVRVGSTAVLAGVLWYIGRIIKVLLEENHIAADLPDTVKVILAGRGSQLFRLFDDDSGGVSYLSELASILLHSVGSDRAFLETERVQLSHNLKREVVLGMLRDAKDAPDLDRPELVAHARCDHFPLLSGVAIQTSTGAQSFDASRPTRSLIQGGSLRKDARVSVDLVGEFTDFLDALDASAGVRIAFAPGKEDAWVAEVENRLRHAIINAPARAADQDIHYVEPPFVIGLRLLVEWIAQCDGGPDDPLEFRIA